MKVTVKPIVIGAYGIVTKGTGGLGRWRIWMLADLDVGGRVETIQIATLLRTARILRNTEKSPGDLRRLSVTQTPVKDHQLKLMLKTLKK